MSESAPGAAARRVGTARTVRLRRRPAAGGRVYQGPTGAGAPPAPVQDWGDIARIYDLEHPAARGDEVRFWDAQARVAGGDVLELAAGSGRIAIALARKGHRVTGLELSEGMLERARGRTSKLPHAAQERLTWVQGDMARFDLSGQRFSLVFVAYNSFWLLPTPAVQAECLACVRRHLAPDGRFVLDLFPPNADDFQDEAGITQVLPMPRRGRALLRVKDYTYEAATGLARSDVRYYATPTAALATGEVRQPPRAVAQFTYSLRPEPPESVRALLTSNGFRIAEELGGYDGEPPGPSAPRAIFICEVA